jgi:hypothetical protein
MTEEKFMFKCDVCGMSYQHGPHRYEGRRLQLYRDIFCCDSCWRGNWDGWAPHYEKALLAHLKQKGLPVPERNAKGWLPRD